MHVEKLFPFLPKYVFYCDKLEKISFQLSFVVIDKIFEKCVNFLI